MCANLKLPFSPPFFSSQNLLTPKQTLRKSQQSIFQPSSITPPIYFHVALYFHSTFLKFHMTISKLFSCRADMPTNCRLAEQS